MQEQLSQSQARRARRILVVDDSPDVTESVSEVLQMLGHTTRVAFDGPTALEVAAEFHPELVLLDLDLPGISGREVARRLRQMPDGDRMTIVALTGWGDQGGPGGGREPAFDGHLIKPTGLEVLRVLAGDASALPPPTP